MALIKFDRTANKAKAIGSSRDADTLYFPTDEQSIYLGGKRVGGDIVSHAGTADSATTAGTATSAGTATIAGKVGHALSLQLNGGSTKNFDGSASVTFNVTPSGIGAAPTSHTHTVSQITDAGAAAKKGVDNSITNAPSANLPTSDAVRAYVTSQIKNYTSAFRYAGTLGLANKAWQVNNIPVDISDTDHMDYGTFVGSSEDDSLLKVGFTFYVTVGGEFNGEVVETGDMVTCVGLYNGEGGWEPSYNIVNSNITVTDTVDKSSKVPTAKAVNTAISNAVNALDSSVAADTNYVLTGVTETDGKLASKKQVAVDQTYNSTSSNPASGKSIAAAIATLDSSKTAKSGSAITGITMVDGKISSITETPVNNYTHPNHTATTGVPTANAAPGFGGTFQVNQIASDSQGHVTSSTSRTITIPATEASTSTKGLMTAAQVTNLNDVLDALTWK